MKKVTVNESLPDWVENPIYKASKGWPIDFSVRKKKSQFEIEMDKKFPIKK